MAGASASLYEAFGRVVSSTGSSDNNRLFCTKERTASIGLDNFGFRYFDWELGRFIQRDPAGYPDGLNNYLYCSNNPISKIDPLGLASLHDDHMKESGSLFKKPEKHLEEAEAAKASYEATKKDVVDTYETQRGGGAGVVEAAANTALVQGLKVPGITQGVEAVSGTNLATGENLSTGERVAKGVESAANLTATLIAREVGGAALSAEGKAATSGTKMAVQAEKAGTKAATAGSEVTGKQGANIAGQIETPYGVASQQSTPEALAVKSAIGQGQTVYRGGAFGKSAAGEGQFWASESPLLSGYAQKYGVASFKKPEFIIGGKMKSSEFVTRTAPPVPPNPGGGIEAVTNPGNVKLDFFHMP